MHTGMTSRREKVALSGMVRELSVPKLPASYDSFVSVSNYHVDPFYFLQLS